MLETIIVALIVGLAAWHAGRRFLPRRWFGASAPAAASCDSGCATCGRCGAGSEFANTHPTRPRARIAP